MSTMFSREECLNMVDELLTEYRKLSGSYRHNHDLLLIALKEHLIGLAPKRESQDIYCPNCGQRLYWDERISHP